MAAPAHPPSITAEFAFDGFFVFRTPLLPFEEVERWSTDLAAPAAGATDAASEAEIGAALAADRQLLRRRLLELLSLPEVAEAVFVASPALVDGLEIWRRDPDSKKGLRAERSLVRYFLRMASRATPFGLFSGCTTAEIEVPPTPAATAPTTPGAPRSRTATAPGGPPTRLVVGPRASYGRHTRLDMDYLFALCEELEKLPAMRAELVYRPNSSLYRAAGRLRYAEARLDDKVRSHHLVAVDSSVYLEATLARAARGAKAADLAAALVTNGTNGTDGTGGADGSGGGSGGNGGSGGDSGADPDEAFEVTLEDAQGFVTELIDSQVLVSDLSPPVTGPEAIHDLVHHLAGLPAGQQAAHRLAAARDALAELDAGGPGASADRYRAIADDLKELPTPVEMARLFQVDMVKPAPAEATLGRAVLDEIAGGIDLLRRLAPRPRFENLETFRKDFSNRYGDQREIPLVEVLDEEIGIGFERSGEVGAEASPLLRGMALGQPPGDQSYPWGARQAVLLAKIQRARAEGAQAIEITDQDLDKMAPRQPSLPRLPDAFQLMTAIAAASPEALDRGEFQVLMGGAAGPSGARLLGRFCHADARLCELTRQHLRAEEAERPQAIYAEIVHLPQGRIGNILSRPLLRDYEIPFLGRSGVPEENQIPVTDLLVSVQGNRIVLRSRRLGREVVPRLTSAHNFGLRSLGIYRFLCTLQHQETVGGLGWSWGPLESAPFLPRVTHGRLVLARAAWWVTGEEIKEIAKVANGTARWLAVQAWRRRRELPRLIMLADGDNELLVDLDNVLSVDAFLDVIEERDRARLLEPFPAADSLIARGPEGRFVHEIVMPMHRLPQPLATPPATTAAPATAAPAETTATPATPAIVAASATATPAGNGQAMTRSFTPGSEWLYAKLYTGTATADRVLREVVAPLVREVTAAGIADSWFFIRYSDPDWHLRVRFHGDPAALGGRLLPALHAAAAPLLADGRLWKLQLDTYEREVERYGGPLGIALAERLFQADSEAVMDILDMLEGDEGADVRWRLAFYGVDALLNDLRLDPDTKMRVLGSMRQSFAQEFATGEDATKALRLQLDQRFRTERPKLDPLLDSASAGDPENPLAPAFEVLARRSRAMQPVLDELRRLEREGLLEPTLAGMAGSLAHMHVNRFIRSAARAHELVLYDLLFQTHHSRAARARKRDAAPADPAAAG